MIFNADTLDHLGNIYIKHEGHIKVTCYYYD